MDGTQQVFSDEFVATDDARKVIVDEGVATDDSQKVAVDEVVATGDADMNAIARAALYEPLWPLYGTTTGCPSGTAARAYPRTAPNTRRYLPHPRWGPRGTPGQGVGRPPGLPAPRSRTTCLGW